jgi:hypothetical protein
MAKGLSCWLGRHVWTTHVEHGESYRECSACGKQPRSPAMWTIPINGNHGGSGLGGVVVFDGNGFVLFDAGGLGGFDGGRRHQLRPGRVYARPAVRPQPRTEGRPDDEPQLHLQTRTS